MEFTLNVFTLNCWGIPVLSKDRKERYEAIAKYLQESSHTIVCLQEVWSEQDYLYLKDSLKINLPYSHYFYRAGFLKLLVVTDHFHNLSIPWTPVKEYFRERKQALFRVCGLAELTDLPRTPDIHPTDLKGSVDFTFRNPVLEDRKIGVLGSGLCVFSKWLMQDVFFHQWPLNGYIHKIHHGDWFGGKGIGLCRIEYHNRLINVYCAHLHAEYHKDDIYLAHRVLQAYSTAEFINLTAAPADISILAGDLNAGPGDLSFNIITRFPPLVDAYDVDLTNSANPMPFGTSDCVNISYANPNQVKICPEGKRIDHILFKVKPGLEAVVTTFCNPLPDRVPCQKFSYSDHNAVSVQLHVKPNDHKSLQKQISYSDFDETVTRAIEVCDEAMADLSKYKTLYLTIGGLMLMFLIGTVGYWSNSILFDIIKIVITGLCFYYIIMGTLWHKIEINCLKAGLSSLKKFYGARIESKKMNS